MSYIRRYIRDLNNKNRKALSIFITAGFPEKKKFADYALKALDAGADILEIGIPFSDPLADGPVIQKTSKNALEEGVNMNFIFEQVAFIREKSKKPLILMGYANTILQFGRQKFGNMCIQTGINGIIVPDIPPEEYGFFTKELDGIDKILLTTPNSNRERIEKIDKLSEGFVYCVSIKGTTGERGKFGIETINSIKKTYENISKNPMLTGFGISGPDSVRKLRKFSDGFIMGSAVLNTFLIKGEADSLRLIELVSNECK